MGHLLCATPNTVRAGPSAGSINPLDARRKLQARIASIPLTNQYGSYVCEATSLGRLLSMLGRLTRGARVAGILTRSIVNTSDPGNHKIHRMSWAAGEMLSALLGYLQPDHPGGSLPQVHTTMVSNGTESAFIHSEDDTRRREEFLHRLHARIGRARTARKAEEIMAGELERMRSRVQLADAERAPVVFLYGPGDYDAQQVAGPAVGVGGLV